MSNSSGGDWETCDKRVLTRNELLRRSGGILVSLFQLQFRQLTKHVTMRINKEAFCTAAVDG